MRIANNSQKYIKRIKAGVRKTIAKHYGEMALIYKHLLDILKFESQLSGEERWNYKGFEELLPFCVAFRDSICDSDTGDADRLNILPKALKCTSRLLSKMVSLIDSKVCHEKLALVVIETMHRLLHLLKSGSRPADRIQQIQRALVDDQSSVVIIYLHILTILEGVAQTAPMDDKPSTQNGLDKEPLTEITLELYQSLITAVYLVGAPDETTASIAVLDEGVACSHKLNTSFEGPLGSQAVLSLLTLVRHRSKRVANNAASCLLLTMRCFGAQRSTWRACFPGTFSGLFLVTQSGYKSGSLLLSRSMQALLLLVYLVGRDTLPENEQLQRHLLADNGVHEPVEGSGGNAEQSGADGSAFGKLLKQLHQPSAIARNGEGMKAAAVTGADKEAEQYVQWRVQVLQRIQQPLAVAYREVSKVCTATQRAALAHALARVISDCAAFLGTACVTTCTAALLSGVADGTAMVRDASRQAWGDVQSALQTSRHLPRDAYLRVNDGLSQRYLDSVRGVSAAALVGNEVKLKDHLHTLLGLGFGLRDHIQSLVRIADHNRVMVHMVRDLLAPDPGVCGLRITASVLETRCYTYQSSVAQTGPAASAVPMVEAGYHRVAWRSTQDANTKELALRLVLALARYGLLEDMLVGARRAFESLQRCLEIPAQATTNTASTSAVVSRKTQAAVSVVAECVCKAAGALSACNIAVLSIAAVSATKPNLTGQSGAGTAKPAEVNCAYCGKTAKSGPASMLRCSRCKGVHYCNKEHQQHHWKLHKALCTPSTGTPTPAATTNALEEASNATLASVDLDNPTSLLTSSLVRVAPRSAQGGADGRGLSAAKQRYLVSYAVRQYVEVVQHYLGLRCSAMVAHSSGGSGAPQWAAYVYLAAMAAEGLANLAFSLGSAFQDHLRQAVYPLLELLVDTEPIVKQAARSSLERIALYSMQATLPRLIRANLDYIVDTVCRQLRSPSTTSAMRIFSSSSAGVGCAATHLIVDAVFTMLGASIQQSSEVVAADGTDVAPMCLLRDVICDTLENIDAFSVESRYGSAQLQALLRVLRVLASRAAPAPDQFTLPVYAAKGVKTQPSKVVVGDKPTTAAGAAVGTTAAVASLVGFAQNLLLLRRSEDLEDVVVQEGENPILEAAQKKGEEEAVTDEKGEENDAVNDATPAPTPAVQLLLDVLERCCLFLTLPHTASQLTVVETMVAAFVRLSPKQYATHLLPCIHRTWPVILNRMKELHGVLCQRSDPVLALAGGGASGSGVRSAGTSKTLLTAEAPSQPSARGTSLLTAVSTTRKAQSTTSAAGHTVSSLSTSSGGGQTGSRQAEVARALLLPALYELVGVLIVASGSFMTIKVKQDLLPEIFRLLAHNLQEYAGGSSIGGTGASGGVPKGKLTMAQLLLTQHGDDGHKPGSAEVAGGEGDSVQKSVSRHTVWSKTKFAVLALLRQCFTIEDGIQRMIRTEVAAIAFLCVPLLSGTESQEVQDAAATLLAELCVLDAATVRTILQSICAPTTATTTKATTTSTGKVVNTPEEEVGATRTWRAVVHHPQVVAAVTVHGGGGGSLAGQTVVPRTGSVSTGRGATALRVVPRAEDLRRQYLRDKALQAAVTGLLHRQAGVGDAGLLQGGDGGRVRDAEWLRRLEQWAVV